MKQTADMTVLGRKRTVNCPSSIQKGCVIFVDTESCLSGITEIGAVAVSISTGNVLDVFEIIADGVRPIENGEELDDPITKMTGLVIVNKHLVAAGQDKIKAEFAGWVNSVSSLRSFVHWCGSEKNLTESLGSTFDACHTVYRPWREQSGFDVKSAASLKDAFLVTMPGMQFVQHRAIEDAIATMGVFCSLTSQGNIL
jgi:hypothetical protein